MRRLAEILFPETVFLKKRKHAFFGDTKAVTKYSSRKGAGMAGAGDVVPSPASPLSSVICAGRRTALPACA